MTDTTIDRCIGLSDRAVHDDSAFEERLTLFAPRGPSGQLRPAWRAANS
ncbi:hypothetical protein [Streptomyces sp. NPDC059894]